MNPRSSHLIACVIVSLIVGNLFTLTITAVGAAPDFLLLGAVAGGVATWELDKRGYVCRFHHAVERLING